MNTILEYVIGLDLHCHAKSVAILSAILEKMTFEVAIFCDFPDTPELKLSLPPEHMAGRM